MITKDKFIELFLKLTEYTIPFGKEKEMEKYLPSGYKKDAVGNYYIEVGNSETLFECHLDSACYSYDKVRHEINGNFIKNADHDILGADDKAGMIVLLCMIEQRKPGVYYFFIGEERNGYGSRKIFAQNPDYFRQFKRSIAFDRKEYGSVVNVQFGRPCCSPEFEKEVVKKLEQNGIKWDPELSHGIGTDNAILMDVIPEVTNLSTGVFYEHTSRECVDIDYLYNLTKAVIKIDWEDLPTVRIPMSDVEYYKHTKKYRYNESLITEYYKFINKKGEN